MKFSDGTTESKKTSFPKLASSDMARNSGEKAVKKLVVVTSPEYDGKQVMKRDKGLHKDGIIRKPLRQMRMELEKKMAILKTNQSEWETFQGRVGKSFRFHYPFAYSY